MKYIDAHSHLTEEQISEVSENEVQAWVLGGIEPEEWKRQLKMKAKWPGRVYPVFGLHPWWLHSVTREKFLEGFKDLEKNIGEAVAIGETGLDAFKERAESLPLQLESFKRHVALSKKTGKPLVLHIVQAHQEAREVLNEKGNGIIHSFSGSFEDAKFYVNQGFHISVSGSVLKEGYKGLKVAVTSLPMENLVLETDSENPKTLTAIAKKVGEMKIMSIEEVLSSSTQNVKNIFKI